MDELLWQVADCVLLMSMDQASAVPVDTHMFQIAAKNYMPHLKKYKTVTDKVYMEIGEHFRKLYGPHAGWAHSVSSRYLEPCKLMFNWLERRVKSSFGDKRVVS